MPIMFHDADPYPIEILPSFPLILAEDCPLTKTERTPSWARQVDCGYKAVWSSRTVTWSVSSSPPARWGLLDFMSVACSSSPPLLSSSPLLLLLLNRDPRSVCPAGPQPRPSTLSVPCRTSTTTIPAQCSLPDLNREYPRPVFPAGPQPRPSTPSVPCRTSTASIHAKCSLPDLM